jgi:hypothetical protein
MAIVSTRRRLAADTTASATWYRAAAGSRAITGRPRTQSPQLSSVEITAHFVAVEACGLELADDHSDVLLTEVLSPVTRNGDHDARLVAEAPMARRLAAEFGKAVID